MAARLSPLVLWPVRRAALAEALAGEPALADLEVVWCSWVHRPSDQPLAARWTPPNARSIGSVTLHRGASLWIDPVDRRALDVVRPRVRDVVPDVVAWLVAAVTATPTWQATHHERAWFLVGDRVVPADRDGFHQERASAPRLDEPYLH